MIASIRYRGVLIPESRVSGEGSADGMTPNYCQGMQVSRSRWLLLYDTVDRLGRDCWRAVFYQVRADTPDGPVLTEKRLTPMEALGTLSDGTEILRSCGQPAIFGVPKGALVGRSVPAHANVFAVTWFGLVVGRRDGQLQRVNQHPELDPAFLEPHHTVLHVRLNDSEDDIEIIDGPRRLQPAVGAPVSGHGWTRPIPVDAGYTQWFDSFSGQQREGDRVLGHRAGVLCHSWDAGSKLYRWSRTGPFVTVREGERVSETCLVRLSDGGFAIAVRSFTHGGRTYWSRTSDPFAGWPAFVERPGTYGQRYAFRCADGVLRIFLNRQDLTPYGDRRNPLYVFDVDPDDFTYSNQQVVMDSRQLGLPLSEPFLDHVHLFEPCGGTQLLSVRAITRAQVWRQDDGVLPTPAEMSAAGIHLVEIEYDGACQPVWRFAGDG